MRKAEAFLILRFLLWKPVWVALGILFVMGSLVKFSESSKPRYTICYGLEAFDLNDPDERAELRQKYLDEGGKLAALTYQPCDLLGAPITLETYKAIMKP